MAEQATKSKPKFDPAPNVAESIILDFVEPKSGQSEHGPWFMLGITHEGEKKSWFLPEHVAKFIEVNFQRGEEVTITKGMKSGDKAHYWHINGTEVPRFVDQQPQTKEPSSNGSAVAHKPQREAPVDTMDRRSALHAAVTLWQGKPDVSATKVLMDAELFANFIVSPGKTRTDLLKDQVNVLASELKLDMIQLRAYAKAQYGGEMGDKEMNALVNDLKQPDFAKRMKQTLDAIKETEAAFA